MQCANHSDWVKLEFPIKSTNHRPPIDPSSSTSIANPIQYNNPTWFNDQGALGYFSLYDWTVCGLHDALDAAGAMGKVTRQHSSKTSQYCLPQIYFKVY